MGSSVGVGFESHLLILGQKCEINKNKYDSRLLRLLQILELRVTWSVVCQMRLNKNFSYKSVVIPNAMLRLSKKKQQERDYKRQKISEADKSAKK